MIQILRFRFPLLVLLALTLISVTESGAQTSSDTYEIYAEGEVADTYSQALNEASLEQFRLRNSRRAFQFEDGTAFELLSAIELVHLGALIDPAHYSTADELNRHVDYVFKVTDQGGLAFRSIIDPSSKLAELGSGNSQVDDRTIIPQAEFDLIKQEKQDYILSNPDKYLVE